MNSLLFLKNSGSINPYKASGWDIFNRLLWDIRYESWRSRFLLKSVKDKYIGEKAVIICNGPSLLDSDLSLLSNVFTFGLNKINLLFDKVDLTPSCIVSVNKHVISQNCDFFNNTDIPLYLDSYATQYVKKRDNTVFLHTSNQFRFAQDCSVSICQGYTVTYVALQLAFHMGFKEVALIGCDHYFHEKGKSNSVVVSSENDRNHFDPNYFSKGSTWQLPDLERSEVAYLMAKAMYAKDERIIYNASARTHLKIFPCISLENFI